MGDDVFVASLDMVKEKKKESLPFSVLITRAS